LANVDYYDAFDYFPELIEKIAFDCFAKKGLSFDHSFCYETLYKLFMIWKSGDVPSNEDIDNVLSFVIYIYIKANLNRNKLKFQ